MKETPPVSIPPILYEDRHLVIVNKPPGVLSESNDTGNAALSDQVALYRAERAGSTRRSFLGIVHRLDRPTSGCLAYALTPEALRALQAQFRERAPRKTYWAVVEKAPRKAEADLVHHLVHDAPANKSRAFSKPVPRSKPARLSYRHLARSDRYHLLEIELKTGRHHQIRAQLAAVGICIKGDLKYGAKRSNPAGGIHLHALRLGITHPTTGDYMEVVAPPPPGALWEFFWGRLQSVVHGSAVEGAPLEATDGDGIFKESTGH